MQHVLSKALVLARYIDTEPDRPTSRTSIIEHEGVRTIKGGGSIEGSTIGSFETTPLPSRFSYAQIIDDLYDLCSACKRDPRVKGLPSATRY